MQNNVQHVPRVMVLVGAMLIANGLQNNASIMKVSNSFMINFLRVRTLFLAAVSDSAKKSQSC